MQCPTKVTAKGKRYTHINETEHNNKKGQDLLTVSHRQSVFRSSLVRVCAKFSLSLVFTIYCMIMSSFV